MKILLLAPHPFYTERGTPIAVRLVAETLIGLGHQVDLLTFHLGQDVALPGLRILRIPRVPFIAEVPIGFSWQKVLCDLLLTGKLIARLFKEHYDVVHAVEESVFPAALLKLVRRFKLVYDMDSSMPEQMMEKWAWLRHFRWLLNAFERFAVRRADLVMPVCPALGDKVRTLHPKANLHPLFDIAFDTAVEGDAAPEDIRSLIAPGRLLALYVGNLEHYQGGDLMLSALAIAKETAIDLVVIGGTDEDIARHQVMANTLHIPGRVRFLGRRPLARLQDYLRQADILLSPRTKGSNTPMKIYSYLLAGKPVLATAIPSHTQVLDDEVALLVNPTPADMARGFRAMVSDVALRRRLAEAARRRALERHTRAAYERALQAAYASLGAGS